MMMKFPIMTIPSWTTVRTTLKTFWNNQWTSFWMIAIGLFCMEFSTTQLIKAQPLPTSIKVLVCGHIVLLTILTLVVFYTMTYTMTYDGIRLRRERQQWEYARKMFDEYEADARNHLQKQSGRAELDNNPISMAAAYIDVHEQYDSLTISNNLFRAILTDNLVLAQEYLNRLDDGMV